VNYASDKSEAQVNSSRCKKQLNFVVALWRLKQVLLKHQQVHKKGDKSTETFQFRLVEPGLVIAPSLDALYINSINPSSITNKDSTTCNHGPLISSISPSSPFHHAYPPIPANSFLVSVDGVRLDRYGQGIKKEYLDEWVDYSDLMWMRGGTGEEDISFDTCNANTGKSQKHTMSMAWNKMREGQGIQYFYEPRLEHLPFEIYGDFLFMPLTENHINKFQSYQKNAMFRYLLPEARRKPKLAVMLLRDGTDAGEALKLVMGRDMDIVETINGVETNTLEDYRQHFFPHPLSGGKTIRERKELIFSLKTASGKQFASFFVDTLKKQESSAKTASYLLTPTAKSAMEKVNALPPTKKQLLEKQGDSAANNPLLTEELGAFSKKKPLHHFPRGSAAHLLVPTAKSAMEELGAISKKKPLLASPRDGAANPLPGPVNEDDDSMQIFGEPLQVVRREGATGILDFALS